MSQSDFGTIDPTTTSGTALATLLGSWRDALHSGHKGATVPSYATAGMLWVDDSADPVWTLKFYDGTNSIVVSTFNSSTHEMYHLDSQFTVANAADPTKQVAISTAGITTGTKRTYTGPDKNGTLALTSDLIDGYTTTATAAGTTTLTVASARQQYFSGSSTQTVTLPVASTLVLGQSFLIVNNSTGDVTVNSSGGNAVQVVAGGAIAEVVCILASGTTAASWFSIYQSSNVFNTFQPIPANSSNFPVGSVVIAYVSGTVANNATIAGTSLSRIQFSGIDGTAGTGPVMSGTWRNISGTTLQAATSAAAGYFVRTA